MYFLNKVPHTNKSAFADGEPVKENCWGTYGSPITESLLLECLPVVEQTFNVKLHPSFSFCRIYFTGAEMKPHLDRPSCEYSISLNVSNDPDPWPIYFADEPLYLNPGDGVVYKGCDVKHWRLPYSGKEQYQIFLHYVDQTGPYASEMMDGRPMLGLRYPNSK